MRPTRAYSYPWDYSGKYIYDDFIGHEKTDPDLPSHDFCHKL